MEWYWIVLICLLSTTLLLLIMSFFYYPFFKRFFDIICSLLVFTILLPFYIVIAILVRLKLGSPIYFKQIRPGKNGKLFTMYKFRSMSNKTDGNGNLLPDGERLTKFGKWLRKTSLDELPEAINILKGDMSVVGPRPLLVKDFVFFDEVVMKRQSVKPGLSGLAQINGRNNISWEKKFEQDLIYIKKISLWKDIAIVFKSFFKAFVKKDDINREGFDTDEDYGDYLLRTKQIQSEQYNCAIQKSISLLKTKEKHHV